MACVVNKCIRGGVCVYLCACVSILWQQKLIFTRLWCELAWHLHKFPRNLSLTLEQFLGRVFYLAIVLLYHILQTVFLGLCLQTFCLCNVIFTIRGEKNPNPSKTQLFHSTWLRQPNIYHSCTYSVCWKWIFRRDFIQIVVVTGFPFWCLPLVLTFPCTL